MGRCRHGDKSRPLPSSPSAQPPDPPRLSALREKHPRETSPQPPSLPHPARTFCLVEASSGGAGDGAEGRFPCAAASPAKAPGRRREHRPFGPSRRCRAGGDRCARSIARAGERDRRGLVASPGTGEAGDRLLRPAQTVGSKGHSPRSAREAVGASRPALPSRSPRTRGPG